MNRKELKGLEEELKNSPNNIALRLTYALKLFKLKEFEQSEKNYQIVLKLDSANVKAKQGLIELYFAKGNYSAVIVIAEELVKANAASEKMMELYAKALLRQNSIEEAQEIYEKIIKNNPFYFDEELDSVLEDHDEYLSDEIGNADDDEFDEEGYDDFFDNPFFDDDSHLYLPDLNIKWDDITGHEILKSFIVFKQDQINSNLSTFHLKKVGLLLYGPSGCGKTYIVRALPSKIETSILPLSIDRLMDVYSYKPEGLIHYYFGKMRLSSPCILFIEDVEKYAQKISENSTLELRLIVSKLAEELDHVRFQEQFVIATTSKPWELDPVFLNTGKFNYPFFIGPPNLKERKEFFKKLFNTRKVANGAVDLLAKESKYYSIGELLSAFDRAITFDCISKGVPTKKTIDADLVLSQLEIIQPNAQLWFEQFNFHWPTSHQKHQMYKDVQSFLVDFD
jgi:transitional endoplasmic reticulum ATPase